ncbi:MAG: hypothetical protein QOC76_4585 [Mycobacterium sp.]|jgi:hypothetical protein|nr:hypothetical protein [Mycobacterium sp.]
MTGSDDGEMPVFHVGQVYPRISDYDRAWSLDGVAVIKLIEEPCFWGFLGWFDANIWPSLVEATVKYPQRIRAADLPLQITGWNVRRSGDFDVTVAYEIRPEATPDSEPVFSAGIRWQGFEMGPFEGVATLLSGPGDSRSSSGPMF